jgi:hypothetical protein
MHFSSYKDNKKGRCSYFFEKISQDVRAFLKKIVLLHQLEKYKL